MEDRKPTGWSVWSPNMTLLYAAELAINHIYSSNLTAQHKSSAIDASSSSKDSVWSVWNIHCALNSEYFDKVDHRHELKIFIDNHPEDRIIKMVDSKSRDMSLFDMFQEFETIKVNYDIGTGKMQVRDYVTVLAWRKAYAAIGSVSID